MSKGAGQQSYLVSRTSYLIPRPPLRDAHPSLGTDYNGAPMPPRDPLFTPRFAWLWAFAFVTFFSAFQLLPAIPFRILDLGGNKAEAGWFLAVYTFSSAFAAPIMGTVADHVGRRRFLITASLLFIVFSVAYGVIPNLPLLLV